MDQHVRDRTARTLLGQGKFAEAIQIYRELCGETHLVETSYDTWLHGLAQALVGQQRNRTAAYVYLYLGQHETALQLLADQSPLERAFFLEQAGRQEQAAQLYESAEHHALAAVAYEKVKRDQHARVCWERCSHDPRLQHKGYERALVHFNLGYCCLRLGDDAGQSSLVVAQRLLEEAADAFETLGQRERAFDCYQILLEMGRRSGAFENLAEGYLNCIRVLKEDNLKYYVVQYYEDFLQQAQQRQEYHAAASLYREAAEYCTKMALLYDQHYLKSAAETWVLTAQKNQHAQGPAEMSENAFLAAVDCYNTVGNYHAIGQVYQHLSQLDLPRRKQERYAQISRRYANAPQLAQPATAFPDYLRQPHAYPDIWHLDLVEWEHDGDVLLVCASVVGDRNLSDIIRRRALMTLVDHLETPQPNDPQRLAHVAESLGHLQVYVVLRPLEKLFEDPRPLVQTGVMKALRYLFFKRTFSLLNSGLRAADEQVQQAAIEALGRLHFNHAFDPLVRIFREMDHLPIRTTSLESIGRIPSLDAGDFLIETLRYEPEPLRSQAKRLLIQFNNADLLPILHQHYQMESGLCRADLEEILRAKRQRL
jgi:hypothetical protein